ESGEKKEARSLLKELLGEHRHSFGFLNFADSHVVADFELPERARAVKVMFGDRLILEKPFGSLLMGQILRSLTVGDHPTRRPALSPDLAAYEKSPSDALFEKILTWLKTQIQPTDKVHVATFGVRTYSFPEFEAELRRVHNLEKGKAAHPALE